MMTEYYITMLNRDTEDRCEPIAEHFVVKAPSIATAMLIAQAYVAGHASAQETNTILTIHGITMKPTRGITYENLLEMAGG